MGSLADDPVLKVAYVHVLPLEYYPPAMNTLAHFSHCAEWKVRAWSSDNARGLPEWSHDGISISRPHHGTPERALALRASGYARWHMQTAIELRKWRPDVVVAVEPHSALAVWMYYSMLGGGAPLFIHHHEYYAEADYARPGMRLLRAARRLERDSLLARAAWVSQTNAARLAMLEEQHPEIRRGAAHVLPNYPPAEWIARGSVAKPTEAGPTRIIYVGAASFEDTFIREAAEWVAAHPAELSLHVVGDNVSPDVWDWLESLDAANMTTGRNGVSYSQLPELLAEFDVGLVLYKGNTLNFVHNVPNKAVEYLACGLEVWYPPEMEGMRTFHEHNPTLRLEQLDFHTLPEPGARVTREPVRSFPFSCETALAPFVREIERVAAGKG